MFIFEKILEILKIAKIRKPVSFPQVLSNKSLFRLMYFIPIFRLL